MSTFETDLEKAKIAERKAKILIEDIKGYPVYFAPEGYYPYYDLRLDLTAEGKDRFEELFEVKNDLGYMRTGNVAIEYGYNGERSGVLKSEAGWYIIVCGDYAHFIRRNIILSDIVNYALKQDRARLIKGGDDDKSDIYLMPYAELKAKSYTRKI